MKKYFLLIFLTISIGIDNTVFCQDIIKTKTGEEIKAKLLKTTRKEATYKTYNDPEFSTYTIPYKELASIQMQGAKKPILFNHRLPRGYISISGNGPGSSIPLGDLQSTSYSNSGHEPGFAKNNNGNIKLEVGTYIFRRLGFSFCLGYFANKFDYQKFGEVYGGANNYSNVSASTPQNNNPGSTNTSTNNSKGKKKSDSWSFTHFLVGPMYSVKIGKRFTWDFKVRAGIIDVRKPGINLSFRTHQGTNTTYHNYSFEQDGHSKTLGYNLGTTFRFSMTKRFSLAVSLDYMHVDPVINIRTNGIAGNQNSGYDKIHYNFSSITQCIGLVYQFKRKRNKYE